MKYQKNMKNINERAPKSPFRRCFSSEMRKGTAPKQLNNFAIYRNPVVALEEKR